MRAAASPKPAKAPSAPRAATPATPAPTAISATTAAVARTATTATTGNDRHQRHQRNNNREVVPSVNKDDLAKLKVAELRAKAAELDVDVAGLKKAELIDAVYDASLKAEGFVEVEGILDIMQDGYGFLRTNGYLPSEQDCYVGLSTIRRNGLRKGDKLTGTTRPARPNEKYAGRAEGGHRQRQARRGAVAVACASATSRRSIPTSA